MPRATSVRVLRISALVALCLLCLSGPSFGQGGIPVPKIDIGVGSAQTPEQVSSSLQILFILTILSLAPALLIMLTSFTRIIIVLSFTRSALGSPSVPPNSVLIGLGLFMTFFTMAPVTQLVNQEALQPYLQHQISFDAAIQNATIPLKDFMLRQTREKDIGLFVSLSNGPRPQTKADLKMHVLIPAFLISELKTAFTIGFVIFIPFLIVDMVVSVTLMSMGMMMLPPVLISLPFKILLFVLVDGWHLVAKSLAESFL